MRPTFSKIASILQVKPAQQADDPVIEDLLTDSRKLVFAEGTLFFAMSSSERNANEFIPPLYALGVRCFITDDSFKDEIKKYPGGNFIITSHVLGALQMIATSYRHSFQIPVIGITGSNGKTIVKEWLYQLLSSDYNIVRSPKSYNSQVGVPLSIWQMDDSHTLAIFEAGISLPNEMVALQKIIEPDIGVFTFSGEAHAEGFVDRLHKVREKLILFANCSALVYCSDDEMLDEAIHFFRDSSRPGLKLFAWSRNNVADFTVENIERTPDGSRINCRYQETNFNFTISFTDDASVHNALTCCSVLLHMGLQAEVVASRMHMLRPVEMRLELKQGINNCSVINDSYSSDINSLNIALDFLSQQQQHKKRSLVLSDVLQTGMPDDELYHKIASILELKNLHRLVGIGPVISSHASAFKNIANKIFFNSTASFLEQFSQLHFHDETILLKGARVFHFEKISRVLEQKLHNTVLEIDLNALRHNFKTYKKKLSNETGIMAMVKAFSYGSGSFEIANLLQHAGVNYLAVAYADEGVELRKAGIRIPIMVMNTEEAGFDHILKYDLEPELYSFRILHAFNQYLEVNEVSSWPVHIKLDTGMHRLGFEKENIGKLSETLINSPFLKIRSVFSHLVASNDPFQDEFTTQQAEQFAYMVGEIERTVGYSFLRHISNTAAISRHPSLHMDMVRLGIGLYGVDENLGGQDIRNVTTLRTTISQIKHVKKGDSVGYGRKFILQKDALIATVRIGYADGYPRILGNGRGHMLVNGQPAPVIGNVCMDMTMLDITGKEAVEEEEVIVFGNKLPVSELSKWANTIPYEILTNISQRVRRVYYEE